MGAFVQGAPRRTFTPRSDYGDYGRNASFGAAAGLGGASMFDNDPVSFDNDLFGDDGQDDEHDSSDEAEKDRV